jgi:hypothetical protein
MSTGKEIEALHLEAVKKNQQSYIDPSTGYTVFTELAHLKRGFCCKNKCRHCPYNNGKVKPIQTQNANSK